MTFTPYVIFSLEKSKGNIAVVVQALEDGLLFSGGSCGTGRSRGRVVEGIAAALGGKEFHVLHDDVHRRAFDALVVFIIPKLYTSADGNFVAFFRVARYRFRRLAPCGAIKKVRLALAVLRGIIPVDGNSEVTYRNAAGRFGKLGVAR